MIMKPSVLFILHTPPPVHGAAMMGKYIYDSKRINEAFDCHYINLATAKDITDIGKVGFRKLRQFVGLLCTIYKEVKRLNPSLVYVTPTSHGGAFCKDFIVVQMVKMMKRRVVVHFHNKGVAVQQNNFLFGFLYRIFFKNLKVILLADSLYKDIEGYVDRKNVYICPNGIPELL